MRPIVCATRGGEASRRTQKRAIALAKERDAELIFLCVVDPTFAGPVNESLAAALKDELRRLGRSLLSIAQMRAREQDVAVQAVTRCGPVWQNIKDCVREVDAETLVIGAPRTESTSQAFGPGDVHRFAETVRQSTDVEVIVVT
jgi:nucleotide-binding universal stress UspA family protein